MSAARQRVRVGPRHGEYLHYWVITPDAWPGGAGLAGAYAVCRSPRGQLRCSCGLLDLDWTEC